MKAISFLGIARYQTTTYVHGDQSCETRFFAEALLHFYPDLEELLLFVTPTAREHENFATVKQLIGDRLHPVDIPEGHSEAELWEIFAALTLAVGEGEKVVFDITNSFRSLPFLVFLAAAFLRRARDVDVAAVLYGAYEAKSAANRSPVFDLSPFVKLLDWLTATDQFVHTGDARFLAALLGKAGANRLAAQQLESLSLAMMLCRPLEVMSEAGKLGAALDQLAINSGPAGQPFALLADRIQEEYAGRALENATEDVRASLTQQLSLIRWYLDHNQTIQAATLAREWLVTGVGWRLQRGFLLSVGERGAIERAISGLVKVRHNQIGEDELSPEGLEARTLAERDHIENVWNSLYQVRNDLDHGGMSRGRMPAATLSRKVRDEIWPLLTALAEAWDLATEVTP